MGNSRKLRRGNLIRFSFPSKNIGSSRIKHWLHGKLAVFLSLDQTKRWHRFFVIGGKSYSLCLGKDNYVILA